MPHDWTLEGDYVETCNCDVACQCLWMEPPDDDICTFSIAWHIQEGRYGDVDLSGLSVALLGIGEEGVLLDPDTGWDVVLLVDEEADEDQRAALEAIYSGEAGGIFAAIADTHVESAEIATAPFSFERDGSAFSVDVGDVVSMEVAGKTGFEDRMGRVSPHPLAPGPDLEMETGKSTTATVSYDERFSWDVAENNAYICDFELASA